ncbi:MAG: hypothetical protein IPP59_18330 [Betaproteobacteria bacterium]|nr:hypothetical protein [Candidatus Dechloromonas phosphorivorans]
MSRTKIETHHYREWLLRMRQGDSDRDIAKSGFWAGGRQPVCGRWSVNETGSPPNSPHPTTRRLPRR